MMVNLVNPKIGEAICDPACGTTGFLISSFEHILKTIPQKNLSKLINKETNTISKGINSTKNNGTSLENTLSTGMILIPP
jgi:type I restriction-modification system DNA methylase subunit